jgi:hypothetical protein
MVGGVVGVIGGVLVSFAVDMGIGTLGTGACWVLLRDCCIYC